MSLPEHLEQQRQYVTSRGESNFNVRTVTDANLYGSLGVGTSWDSEAWERQFQVDVKRAEGHDMEFDLINLDPAIANALRRILIAEIPSVAIEHVFFVNNTSIIADEVFAHRLGLVPLNINPDKLEFKRSGEGATERNTVVFKLKAQCKRLTKESFENDKVLTSSFQWLPNGSEMPEETSCRFATGQLGVLGASAEPVHKDILLAKLRPGQCIDLEAHATKGLGAEHAKWSPVATAWYRLYPEVVLKGKVKGKDAEQLAELCPGLFSLHKTKSGDTIAKAETARGNEKHLEKVRRLSNEEKWRDKLELRRRKEHFIFTIESVGAEPPEKLFIKALDVLSAKCDKISDGL